jgi:ADP-heptose:LPS heptosyltransferase
MGRLATRLRIFPRALATRLRQGRRSPPRQVSRVLVVHRLLLGDTLMLSPLLARLRAAWPKAAIDLAVSPAFVPLYAGRPWGVNAIGWHPADPDSLSPFLEGDDYDLALVPGDNRYSWLAQAAGARWIVAHAGDVPSWKNWPIDELRPLSAVPSAWGDMVADLVDGPPAPVYHPSQWPAPPAAPFDRPRGPLAVLHVGASTPLKRWSAARWHAVADRLEAQGLRPVFLAGRGEESVVTEIDPAGRWVNLAGRLDLAQVWQLLADARLLIAPDTGVSHLGRLAGTPTITLFGPGSAIICGAGEFWRGSSFWPVTVADFPCRDQTILFRRSLTWVRRCGRSTRACEHPRCMDAIELDRVDAAIGRALAVPWPRTVGQALPAR